ncbi:hypothetical protein Tco_1215552, partial [Tanacetum coccineum]
SEVHTADQLPLPRYGLDAPPARAGLSDGYDRTIDASLKAGCQESCLYIRRAGMRGTLGQDSESLISVLALSIREEGRRFQSEALTEGCACPWPHLPIF